MGSATVHGFPYPVGTDRVMVGDNAMQALAQYTDDYLLGAKAPKCKLTQPSWSCPNNVTSQVSFVGGAVAYDTDAMADLANSTIRINHAGWYVAWGFVPWTNNATGFRVALLQSGNPNLYLGQDYRPAVSGTSAIVTFNSDPTYLAAGANVILRLLQNSGSAMAITNGNGMPMSLAVTAYLGT